jgi:S1-C subfamily serine protease
MALALSIAAGVVGGVAAQQGSGGGGGAPGENRQGEPRQGGMNRAFLGISIETTDAGVVVTEVIPGSPAAAAGIQVGDVIAAVNGTAVEDARSLSELIAALDVGTTAALEVTREGESLALEATLGALRGFGGMFDDFPPGMFRDMMPDMMFQFDMDGTRIGYGADGWTILALPETAPLYEAGLREGDVITAVDGQALDPMQLGDYLATLEADEVTLTLTRDGETQDLTVAAAALETGLPFGGGFRFEFGVPGRRGMPEMHGMPFMQPFAMNMLGNGRLGLTFVTLDEAVAEERGVEQTDGALIVEVVAESPAALAGVQPGDVVTAVNGEPVDAERTLRDRLIAYEPGDTISLTVIREGETLTLEATLAEPELMGMFDMIPGIPPGMMPELFDLLPPDHPLREQMLPPGHPPIDGMPGAPDATPRPNV